MYVKDLETLKYAELQKLAKSAGIKANQKIEKLIQALKDYYIENEKNSETKDKSTEKASLESSNQLDLQEKKSNKEATTSLEKQNNVNDSGKTPDTKLIKKRRRTFELDTPTLGPSNTPNSDGTKNDLNSSNNRKSQDEPQKKRLRKNTFSKESPKMTENKAVTRASGSPGTKAIIDSLTDLPSPERKKMILSAIDKKLQKDKDDQPSQIPRYVTYLANKKLENQQVKPTTPGNKNWAKIHDKEFSKFDSLDVYLEKKQQRMESLTGSAKSVKMLKKMGPKIVKPVCQPQQKGMSSVKARLSTISKTPGTDKKADNKSFVPTVTNVKNLSFNFVKSPYPIKTNSENKTVEVPATTPFKFTGNTTSLNSTVSSNKKCFDLKASLAKPLSWKPHAGKLQPLNCNKSMGTISSRPTRQSMASKARPVQAKDIQRVKQLDRRNNQKYLDMMKRRGLV